jgi:hypothetical protein
MTNTPFAQTMIGGVLIAAVGGVIVLYVQKTWFTERPTAIERLTTGEAPTVSEEDRPPNSRAISATKQCNNVWEAVTISSNRLKPTRINPDADCDWTLRAPGRCVMVKRADWTLDKREYGPFCDDGASDKGRIETPSDVEWTWSTGGGFTAQIILKPMAPGSR